MPPAVATPCFEYVWDYATSSWQTPFCHRPSILLRPPAEEGAAHAVAVHTAAALEAASAKRSGRLVKDFFPSGVFYGGDSKTEGRVLIR